MIAMDDSNVRKWDIEDLLELKNLRHQDFLILEDDLGFYLESYGVDFDGFHDSSLQYVSSWSYMKYGREWGDAGMTYHEINSIAQQSPIAENPQVFSSRHVTR